MFERFTEPARRVIFFARYEASVFGSPFIDTEHLLLGMMREAKGLFTQIPPPGQHEIRGEIERLAPERQKISTTVDLPLSEDCKGVLGFGMEESKALGHGEIEPGHLLLGILRMEGCLAAKLLRQHGMEPETVRQRLIERVNQIPPLRFQRPARTRPAERFSAWQDAEETRAAAPAFSRPVHDLRALVDGMLNHLQSYSEPYGRERLKRKPWSRKEAMLHLVDWAAAHHQWFVRALAESRLTAAGYPQDDWVSTALYQELAWPEVVDAWIALNRIVIHVLAAIPEEKANIECRIGLADPVPLSKLAVHYVEHCQDLSEQILARLG